MSASVFLLVDLILAWVNKMPFKLAQLSKLQPASAARYRSYAAMLFSTSRRDPSRLVRVSEVFGETSCLAVKGSLELQEFF